MLPQFICPTKFRISVWLPHMEHFKKKLVLLFHTSKLNSLRHIMIQHTVYPRQLIPLTIRHCHGYSESRDSTLEEKLWADEADESKPLTTTIANIATPKKSVQGILKIHYRAYEDSDPWVVWVDYQLLIRHTITMLGAWRYSGTTIARAEQQHSGLVPKAGLLLGSWLWVLGERAEWA